MIHSYNDLWDHRFNALVEFKNKNGHCNVPYRWKEDTQVGRWVQNQREFYKRKTLSPERYNRLKEVGFAWSLKLKKPLLECASVQRDAIKAAEKAIEGVKVNPKDLRGAEALMKASIAVVRPESVPTDSGDEDEVQEDKLEEEEQAKEQRPNVIIAPVEKKYQARDPTIAAALAAT